MTELQRLRDEFVAICEQMARFVVGQEEIVEHLVVALLAGEHCLYEGPPGVARSLTVQQLAAVTGLSFAHLHCNEELVPEDFLSVESEPEDSTMALRPLQAEVVLFDDVPRLTPRMLSLLHQAIKEQFVKIREQVQPMASPCLIVGNSYRTDDVADDNENARDDRFMLKLAVRYPSYDEEYEMAELRSGPDVFEAKAVWDAARVLELREFVRGVSLPPPVAHYALRLVRATRVHEDETPDVVYEYVQFGAGPRATHFLTLGAKIRAALHGRSQATAEDILSLAPAVLRHRIWTNQNARTNGVSVDRVIDRLLYEIPQRAQGDDLRRR